MENFRKGKKFDMGYHKSGLCASVSYSCYCKAHKICGLLKSAFMLFIPMMTHHVPAGAIQISWLSKMLLLCIIMVEKDFARLYVEENLLCSNCWKFF